eukprot:NODE_2184_length_2272_cov_4.042890.p1 GENE.NODE_2184_length_2272_cov_4.042890~~NODE_2184_length_2272_cov_4.042890.p1  ORF type:complete len:697 (+),score=70.09 NODE_2184_length_2272_cov_4.042890:47-2092(+)
MCLRCRHSLPSGGISIVGVDSNGGNYGALLAPSTADTVPAYPWGGSAPSDLTADAAVTDLLVAADVNEVLIFANMDISEPGSGRRVSAAEVSAGWVDDALTVRSCLRSGACVEPHGEMRLSIGVGLAHAAVRYRQLCDCQRAQAVLCLMRSAGLSDLQNRSRWSLPAALLLPPPTLPAYGLTTLDVVFNLIQHKSNASDAAFDEGVRRTLKMVCRCGVQPRLNRVEMAEIETYSRYLGDPNFSCIVSGGSDQGRIDISGLEHGEATGEAIQSTAAPWESIVCLRIHNSTHVSARFAVPGWALEATVEANAPPPRGLDLKDVQEAFRVCKDVAKLPLGIVLRAKLAASSGQSTANASDVVLYPQKSATPLCFDELMDGAYEIDISACCMEPPLMLARFNITKSGCGIPLLGGALPGTEVVASFRISGTPLANATVSGIYHPRNGDLVRRELSGKTDANGSISLYLLPGLITSFGAEGSHGSVQHQSDVAILEPPVSKNTSTQALPQPMSLIISSGAASFSSAVTETASRSQVTAVLGDISGSMRSYNRMEVLKRSFHEILSRAKLQDHPAIVGAWSTRVDFCEGDCTRWIEGLSAGGENDMQQAIEQALAKFQTITDLYIMGDGDVSPFTVLAGRTESSDWSLFRARFSDVRFHFVALGKGADDASMQRMAAIGDGSFASVK